MDELWLIITGTVGILAVIAAVLLTKKKQKVISLVFGGTDQLLGQSLLWLSLLLAIISAIKGLSQK